MISLIMERNLVASIMKHDVYNGLLAVKDGLLAFIEHTTVKYSGLAINNSALKPAE